MSAAGTPSGDPWLILARERVRYEEQFRSLKPTNGFITGEQAKGFLLQSRLQPQVLGQIWSLADTDADGNMDINEFSIACKLINLKLRNFDIPKSLPPSLLASLQSIHTTTIPQQPIPPSIPPSSMPNNLAQAPLNLNSAPAIAPPRPQPPKVPPMIQPIQPPIQPSTPPVGTVIPTTMGPIPTGIVPPMVVPMYGPPAGVAGTPPTATSTPRASITSLERTNSVESAEWAVPHHIKLKYTQMFNTTDRQRSGYLSGAQARNVMMQTKLPQALLATIWNLSDMDGDGRLGCEEFVLAMYLCEQASTGQGEPPAQLPPQLIPPSFRKSSLTTSTVTSPGAAASIEPNHDLDPSSTLLQTSFEDKRKENFEKGQAELERRRKTLLDQQRKEAEERERKEREEMERREKARLEAERKRLEEIERQMREQQEQERLKEEERKRQAEQREAARKEMERQRQLEWEKQRLQELQMQRQREQESVLKLKAKNQSLTIELSTLNEQVRELSQKICDTRVGVSNVKSTIDGMRSTRDSQMQEMSQLKAKLKEQNARLLSLSQEKAKLDARNKLNAGGGGGGGGGGQDDEQSRIAFENKEINIRNLRKKIEEMQEQIDGRLEDIENNNTQLSDLREQMRTLLEECDRLYGVYENKKQAVLEMKNSNRTIDYNASWQTGANDDAWGAPHPPTTTTTTTTTNAQNEWPQINDNEWPVAAATAPSSAVPTTTPAAAGLAVYRALYEFSARNNDEISFQPGDVINVHINQVGEPGWLVGEIGGRTGWFPESYVEPAAAAAEPTSDNSDAKRLEGIEEVPEATIDNAVVPTKDHDTMAASTTLPEDTSSSSSNNNADTMGGDAELYIATYPYQSQEQGDLTFNAGETIAVVKKDGDWWTGKLGAAVGIFPSNYVQKLDVVNASSVGQPAGVQQAAGPPQAVSAASALSQAVTSALENVTNSSQGDDNEVSQITSSVSAATIPDSKSFTSSAMTPSSQVQTRSGSISGSGKKPEIAQVIAAYEATSEEQLSLARGQLIMIRKKNDSGWWEGELQAKGRKRQVGWFPAAYVKVLNSSGRASGRTTPVSTSRMQQELVIDKVVALYPYSAQNADELTFAKDDIISVTARDEEAWWRGELNGISGLFPSNYVTPLQQQQQQ